MLSERAKARRRKLTEVNIKVAFIAWLIEFVGSILLPFVPKIFGHGLVGTGAGDIIILLFYFVLLPFSYLINDSDIKSAIVDENWFHAIIGIFNRTNIEVFRK